MIRIGYHTIPIMDQNSTHTTLNLDQNSILEFKGTAHIGMGSKISVGKGGILTLGNNFAISAFLASIAIKKSILEKMYNYLGDVLLWILTPIKYLVKIINK